MYLNFHDLSSILTNEEFILLLHTNLIMSNANYCYVYAKSSLDLIEIQVCRQKF